jgi:hypothetical protein
MELKLVVKEKGKGKKKTYTANAVDLSFGVVDERDGKANVGSFFNTVKTPDNPCPKITP